jgi:hypothetical protein
VNILFKLSGIATEGLAIFWPEASVVTSMKKKTRGNSNKLVRDFIIFMISGVNLLVISIKIIRLL